MKSNLTFELLPINEVTPHYQDRMFHLMNLYYDKISQVNFIDDLKSKQWVGLVMDGNDEVQGFTTFAINPGTKQQKEYNVLFSGDTILAQEHWGSQIIVKGWCHSVGRIISSDPSKKWYWYLLSKGHRTYMYLPLFFQNYYPSVNSSADHDELKKIASSVSEELFGSFWNEEKGVIRFDHSRGELKVDLAESTFEKSRSTFVNFFLKKNPFFHQGQELVCVASLHPDNMLRSAKKYMIEGMEDPINRSMNAY